MEKGIPPEQICEEIMTECLSPDLLMTGTDNMTIVLICFLHNKSYEDFCKRAAEYCLRLFPDDEKFSTDKSVDNQSPAKCENGLFPTSAVISQTNDDDEADDSSSNSDDDQPNDKNKNGDAGVNADAEKNQSGNDENPSDSTQENKKFKEEDDSEDLK